MVVVAQLVRASDCGSEGRGFETHHPPKKKRTEFQCVFFIWLIAKRTSFIFQKVN